jgi:hypothetical protein
MEDILSSIKAMDSKSLFKLAKAALSEAEKKTKSAAKSTKTKRAGSMPKGAVPNHLKKNNAWVQFTLKHALENGWESFTIHHKKKGDEEESTEVVPASIEHEGKHIIPESINEKTPSGRTLIHKDAMSLSKHRKEANHATYAEFEAQYVDDSASEGEAESTTSSKSKSTKKTAEEKAAEKLEKQAQKETEKAEKLAQKEKEKAEKLAQKEKEKAEKLAQKEAEKAQKAAAKPKKTEAPTSDTEIAPPAAAVKKTVVKKKPSVA